MNNTPNSERIHISFFGKRNAGKSSLLNAFTGQDIAIVSDIKGTTTDPVSKAMELLPLGPAVIIDTPGIDDTGTLGQMRVKKARQTLNKTDLAILVVDAAEGISSVEEELIEIIRSKDIPYIIAYNKCDLLGEIPDGDDDTIYVSALTKHNIHELKELAAKKGAVEENKKQIVKDLLTPEDAVILVVPIDKSAPKGRLILPQQQTIRDILDGGASALVCRETELAATLGKLKNPPRMVITDSQVFGPVSKMVPEEIPLTSFSILMARYKSDLALVVEGVNAVNTLKDGDKVLIAEGCTHHRQCEDIGTVKIPALIRKRTGQNPEFIFTSGTQFPDDVSEYKMVIHCGGCMLTEREVLYRMRCCKDQNIPVTNYGILLAYLNGILKRTIMPFEGIRDMID